MSRQTSGRMVMAALRELDPAGPPIPLTEDERARADATFTRLVATTDEHPLVIEPDPPRRRHRLRLPVAAVLLGAVGLATSALVLGGSAYGSWTPTPTPLEANTAAAAATTCRSALDVPDRVSQVLIAERRGDWTYVLLGASHTEAACLLPNDVIGQGAAALEGKTFGEYDPDVPPAPHVAGDDFVETMHMSGSTDEGLLNWSEGYVGGNVVGVTVHTPSGLVVTASVSRGRFAAWWPAGEAKADNPEFADAPTFTVILADGSTRRTSG